MKCNTIYLSSHTRQFSSKARNLVHEFRKFLGSLRSVGYRRSKLLDIKLIFVQNV